MVAKLETKAPELFAQLAATGGATDEEKLQQLPLSSPLLRLHYGAVANLRVSIAPIGQIGAGSHGVCIAAHLFDEGDTLCIGADGGSWRRAPTAARRWSVRIPTST